MTYKGYNNNYNCKHNYNNSENVSNIPSTLTQLAQLTNMFCEHMKMSLI